MYRPTTSAIRVISKRQLLRYNYFRVSERIKVLRDSSTLFQLATCTLTAPVSIETNETNWLYSVVLQ